MLFWQNVIAESPESVGFDDAVDYGRRRRERKDERAVIGKLEDVVAASMAMPARDGLEDEAKTALQEMRGAVAHCEAFLEGLGGGDDASAIADEVLLGLAEDALLRAKEAATRTLKDTTMEFAVSALHWRWHAVRYLIDLERWREREAKDALAAAEKERRCHRR